MSEPSREDGTGNSGVGCGALILLFFIGVECCRIADALKGCP